MADKYLVPCSCGRPVAVAVNQAGSQVRCECGTPVDVPPLRKLREYPRETIEVADDQPDWSVRHAMGFAGLVLTILLLAGAAWLSATQREMPKFQEVSEDIVTHRAESMLENGKPLDYWNYWLTVEPILTERGFEEITHPGQSIVEQSILDHRLYRNLVLAAAGVVAALTAVAWLCWPRRAA